MKVLVTGGAGYIGSVTVAVLREAGFTVAVLDDLRTGHRAAVPEGVPLHAVSLADAGAVAAVLADGFDAVVHFAASSLVGESVREPGRYWKNNVAGTLVLVEAAAAAGVRRFVFSSSAAVYGEPATVPIPETAPLAPVNPYGRTKAAMEWLLADVAAAHGMTAVALRYFNAAGAWNGLGEDHRPETHLIPRLLRSLLVPGETFALYGDDYPTPDGTCIRDYIHVHDLAAAHAAALEADLPPGLTALNLGTGRGYSVREVVAAAARITGRPLDPPVRPRRPGDPARLVARPDRAADLLDWEPRRSDLETIVRDAWRWHSAHPAGYGPAGRG